MDVKDIARKWQPKAHSFFSAVQWKNVFVFLLFLLVAFIFWMMLFFQRDVESVYSIPVKYSHVPDDVVFDNPLPDFIEIRVADKGSEIFKLDLTQRDSLEINVEEIKESGTNALQGNQYLQLIRSRLSSSTNLRGYSPASISLATSKLQSKKLTVAFDGEITTNRANLVADSATFIPETVMAYGSRQSLNELEKAFTEYTVFNNLKSTSQLSVKIKPVQGVKFVPDKVEIYIPIEEFTERTFEVPITAKNVPGDVDVKFFPSRANASFSVTLEEYKKIAPEDFEIELDYRKFHANENGRVDLELSKSPATIINPRISPTSVEFLLENR